jgi:chromosomal replication initiator protein
MSVEELWQQALTRIQAQLGSTPAYKTMFETSRLVGRDDAIAQIEVPNRFMLDQMRKNHYDTLIAGILRDLEGVDYVVEFVVPAASQAEARPGATGATGTTPAAAPAAATGPAMPVMGILNPKYTFGTFVIGTHSHFAHAAANAVADSPAKAYNPLFIYGGVGLGKTHLMHAIAHHILARNPVAKVAYLSSEKFTNELINAIRDDKMMDFKNRYRTIDLLLIDDIQFLEGKERTQEEFFHTFNALHEAGKQIVLSSDRPPKEIAALQDRLRSRFEWGLITDIQTPDLETRIAILKKKAEVDGYYANDEVLHYIAAAYPNNVRELEGAFIRVMAYAGMTNVPVTMALAQQVLGEIAPAKQVTCAEIIDIVSAHFRLEAADLVGNRRTKDIAHARQVAMYLSREMTGLSLNIIGSKFGGRDHTTVMYGVEKIREDLGKNTQLAGDMQKLVSKIKG